MKKLAWLALAFVVLCSQPAFAKEPFAGFGLGLKAGYSKGHHTIDFEIDKYRVSIVEEDLTGPTYGLTAEYLFSFANWRVGPQLQFEKASLKSRELIGDKYVNFTTTLQLEEIHTLRLMAGYVYGKKFMPYVFGGVTAGLGTLSGSLNVLSYELSSSDYGWIAGYSYGVGVRYLWSKHLDIGLEFSHVDFGKKYTKCNDKLNICASLPIKINPRTVSLMLTYRF